MPVLRWQREQCPVVAVPDSSVIDTGTRQVVILNKGEGRFEARVVKIDLQGGASPTSQRHCQASSSAMQLLSSSPGRPKLLRRSLPLVCYHHMGNF